MLVIGGSDGNYLNTTEIFDVNTRSFTPGPNLLTRRSDCAAVALDACRILVFGGFGDSAQLATTEVLNVETMTATAGPNLSCKRDACAAVRLDARRVVVIGGYDGENDLNTTEVLDVEAMTFTPGPTMLFARADCTAVLLDSQHVLIAGGEDSHETPTATTEVRFSYFFASTLLRKYNHMTRRKNHRSSTWRPCSARLGQRWRQREVAARLGAREAGVADLERVGVVPEAGPRVRARARTIPRARPQTRRSPPPRRRVGSE